MGCICKNNKNEIIIEAKTEYKTDLINNETNINEDDNQSKEKNDINKNKLL